MSMIVGISAQGDWGTGDNEQDNIPISALYWGFTYLLLHCEEAIVLPSYTTLSKGEPDAKIALPLVHLCAASAVHSAREVGFDNGIMTGGLSWPSFMVVKTSSTKKPIKR